jgi:hypothetical protein
MRQSLQPGIGASGATGMARKDYEEKYTNPELREKLKEQIKQSGKGGKPGQWSARKSQMLVQEYEKHGGGYRKGRKDEQAKSLEDWTSENWQTREGEARARKGDKTKRYLPEKAWKQLSDEEAAKTDRRKQEASKQGRQYVPNTEEARQARREVIGGSAEPSERQLHELAKSLRIPGRSKMSKAQLKRAIRKHYTDRVHEMKKQELYDMAQDLDIRRRSSMSKSDLAEAVRAAI